MSVDLVMLDVSVKDSNGKFVGGLTTDAFKIRENGTPQEVRYFQTEDMPVTSGIVLDGSASMRQKRSEAILAALSFL
jgi:VWFA-related protein